MVVVLEKKEKKGYKHSRMMIFNSTTRFHF